jgi:hypothetical protein
MAESRQKTEDYSMISAHFDVCASHCSTDNGYMGHGESVQLTVSLDYSASATVSDRIQSG